MRGKPKRYVFALIIFILVALRFIPVQSYTQEPSDPQRICDIGVITQPRRLIRGESLSDVKGQEYTGCARIEYYLYVL